jgi:hypothetical protein
MTIRATIVKVVAEHGPLTTSELRAANGELAPLSSLPAHLGQLERLNKLARDGEGRWRLA